MKLNECLSKKNTRPTETGETNEKDSITLVDYCLDKPVGRYLWKQPLTTLENRFPGLMCRLYIKVNNCLLADYAYFVPFPISVHTQTNTNTHINTIIYSNPYQLAYRFWYTNLKLSHPYDRPNKSIFVKAFRIYFVYFVFVFGPIVNIRKQ